MVMDSDLQNVLARTLHLDVGDVPWTPSGPGTELRVLHARPEESFIALQYRAQPGAETPLHRHKGLAFGFTIRGHWGHDRQYLYRPGTYLFETPEVVHQFLNGPEVTEAYFVNHGDLEMLDADGHEVAARFTITDMMNSYFQACESAEVTRPNILR
jgi:quercetin dioxygenase-like cupin family protein